MAVPAAVRNKALAAGADRGRRLAGFITRTWEELDRPCSERAVAEALAWGVVERVSTGLLLTRIGLQPVGREMLAAADYVCGA
jgi:hypothetical protein